MKYHQLYIKTDCPFCKEAINILEKEEKEFVVTVLDHAPEEVVQEVKNKFGQNTVPIVLEYDSAIGLRKVGGCDDLKKELNIKDAEIIVSFKDMTDEEKKKELDFWHEHGEGD